jgi:ADP-heptose:LPS heptosyltransferase
MKHWPTSVPDYKWPDHYASNGMAPLRWGLSAVFHVAHAIGRAVGFVAQRLGDYEVAPTMLIRTDGVGDALLFEPAMESLAKTISPSELHLWAPRGTCQLFEECATITRRVVTPRGGKDGNLEYFKSIVWRARLGFELGRWTFEKVVYPVQSGEPLGNWLFVSARATERWINTGDLNNQFDWQQERTHDHATRFLEARPGSNAHELQRNEYLTDQWAEENRLRRPRVHMKPAAAQQAETLVSMWRRAASKLDATELAGLVVAGAAKVNQYPAQRWAAALTRLWEEQRVMAVLLGGPNDQAAMDEVAAQLGDVPHLRLLKPVHLLTMAGIIRRLDGMLSVDTGLAHIALAQRVPTVVLVGGGSPGRFFPWPHARDHVVLNHAMPCDGCNNKCHLPEPLCITRISCDDIVEAYLRLRTDQHSIVPFVVPTIRRKAAG